MEIKIDKEIIFTSLKRNNYIINKRLLIELSMHIESKFKKLEEEVEHLKAAVIEKDSKIKCLENQIFNQ
ncbi:hypothetical protein BpHYR1_028532 [Brachionus plicatilis]|uniref:Uncharacterized protein n=1 Tax=Brachionus plicatilis TaxID=10195 RepID=A0A3M7PVH1_BRAPC|nr:hypothetical protein BpHYR1_028532 [Brachionus plicatilis]